MSGKWTLNRLLSWVSPEEDSPSSPELGHLSGGGGAAGDADSTSPLHPRSSSRPVYFHNSSLRTIEESNSSYGSYSSPSTAADIVVSAASQNGPSRAAADHVVEDGTTSARTSSTFSMYRDRADSVAKVTTSGSSNTTGEDKSRESSSSSQDRNGKAKLMQVYDAEDAQVQTDAGPLQVLALPQEGVDNPVVIRPSSPSITIMSTAEDGTRLDEGLEPTGPWYKGPLFDAGCRFGLMFLVFTIVIIGAGWTSLPKLDQSDKDGLKLPRSFEDIKALNALFQKYKHNYPTRILTVGVSAYLYVQMFILPGSMYISILFGAAYGAFYGTILSCLCEAFGSLLCYALSAVVGPPLLTIPSYRNRLELWRTKIMGDPSKGETITWDGVFSFLIVLRIAPLPPHWITNVVAPHLGISPILFWFSCFLGMAPISVIYCTIGSGLDGMTSSDDFQILSLKNILGLVGIGVAVMIPTALKRVFKKDLSGLDEQNEATLRRPGIHLHDVSGQGSEYDEDEYSDQGSDRGSLHEHRSYNHHLRHQRPPSSRLEYMNLDKALGIIQQDEEHEVLAVAYPGTNGQGEEADRVLEMYERHVGREDQDDDDEDEGEDDGRDRTRGNGTAFQNGSRYPTATSNGAFDLEGQQRVQKRWWSGVWGKEEEEEGDQ